jgi:hypothetical protein
LIILPQPFKAISVENDSGVSKLKYPSNFHHHHHSSSNDLTEDVDELLELNSAAVIAALQLTGSSPGVNNIFTVLQAISCAIGNIGTCTCTATCTACPTNR